MSQFHTLYQFSFPGGGGSIDLSPFFQTPGVISPRWTPPGYRWTLAGDETYGLTSFGSGTVEPDGVLEPGDGFDSCSGPMATTI